MHRRISARPAETLVTYCAVKRSATSLQLDLFDAPRDLAAPLKPQKAKKRGVREHVATRDVLLEQDVLDLARVVAKALRVRGDTEATRVARDLARFMALVCQLDAAEEVTQ